MIEQIAKTKTLQEYLRRQNTPFADRLKVLWEMSAPIHARQTSIGANEGGFAHCKRVEQYIWTLITKSGKLQQFEDIELFILSCSACCHDFDKGLDSVFEEAKIHGKDSGRFVYENANQLILHIHEADIIDQIIAIHDRKGEDFALAASKLTQNSPIGTENVNIQKLAAVLKAGDVLHTDFSRISDLAVDVDSLSEFDRRKHLARRCVTGWNVDGQRVIINATPANAEELEAVNIILNYLKEYEWRPLATYLNSNGLPHELETKISPRRLDYSISAMTSRELPGMDYYHEEDAAIFAGRKSDINMILNKVLASQYSSLAGISGVGKSSLLHAGLKPLIDKVDGWRCVITRPDKSTGSLYTLSDFDYLLQYVPNNTKELAIALSKQGKIFIVFDQFEDIIYFGNFNIESLAEELLSFQVFSPQINILFCYRQDVIHFIEPLENKLAHSDRGLHRYFLQPLDTSSTRESIEQLLKLRKIDIEAELMSTIILELVKVTNAKPNSKNNVVYPPYIQMVVERLTLLAERNSLKLESYLKLAGDTSATERIIADYLSDNINRLEQRGHSLQDAKRVLITLSHTSGKKGAVSKSRISAEAAVPNEKLSLLLKDMSSLRLVRRLVEDQWEIAHDILASRVSEDLFDAREVRFKHAREALDSKVKRFEYFKSLLSYEEMRTLWLSRERLPPEQMTDEERVLILISMFSIDSSATSSIYESTWNVGIYPYFQRVPGWYWYTKLSKVELLRVAEMAAETHAVGGIVAFIQLIYLLEETEYLSSLFQILTIKHWSFGILDFTKKAILQIATRDSIPVLRSMIHNSDKYVREVAVAAIEKLAIRDDLPLLREMLNGTDEHVRYSIMKIIGKVAIQDDLSLLRKLLNNGNKYAKKSLAEAILRLADRDDLPLLREMLKNSKRYTKKPVAEAILRLADRDDLPLFKEMLKDDDDYTRKVAVGVIRKVATQDDLPLLQEMLKDDDEYISSVSSEAILNVVTQNDLPLLREMLKDDDEYVREAAVEAIGKLAVKSSLSLLPDMLKDDDEYVCEAAAKAISQLATRDDLPLLREMLKDDDEYVRKAAVEIICTVVIKDNMPLLRKMLNNSDNDVWQTVGNIIKNNIFQLPNIDDLSVLRRALNSSEYDYYVRRALAKAIAVLGARDDLLLFKEMLKSGDKYVRESAILAIFRLVTRDNLLLLMQVLKGSDNYAWKETKQAITQLLSKNDLPLLKEILNSRYYSSRGTVGFLIRTVVAKLDNRDDLPLLREMLKHDDEYIRSISSEAIGKLATRYDLPLLREMLEDGDKYVRRLIAVIIGKVATKYDLPLLREMLGTGDKYVQRTIAVIIGKVATRDDLPLLREMLGSGDKYVRKLVLVALGKLGELDRVLDLTNMLDDKDYDTMDIYKDASFIIGSTFKNTDYRAKQIFTFLKEHSDSFSTHLLGIFDWHLYTPDYIQKAYKKLTKNMKQSAGFRKM